jgi:16S rRNA (guanine966-N2)-methyltransferase
MPRIIAGRHRGKRLETKGLALRPTSERGREAVFDILAHGRFGPRPIFEDAQVLDAFAGTGAMGLEALSRGARFVTFMETDRAARRQLERTLAEFGETAHATVLAADALNPPRAAGAATLAFLDPPYDRPVAAEALAALGATGWIAPGALIVVELPARGSFAAPAGMTLIDERRYGAARFLFLRA